MKFAFCAVLSLAVSFIAADELIEAADSCQKQYGIDDECLNYCFFNKVGVFSDTGEVDFEKFEEIFIPVEPENREKILKCRDIARQQDGITPCMMFNQIGTCADDTGDKKARAKNAGWKRYTQKPW